MAVVRTCEQIELAFVSFGLVCFLELSRLRCVEALVDRHR